MKVSMLATTFALLWSTGAFAANPSAAERPVPLREVVAHLESRNQGEVVAIALDAGGDKAAHYHADLPYPGAGTAKLDVDAATLEISAREQPYAENGWTSLAGAAAYAAIHLNGQVVAAAIDAVDGGSAHYDIDVRLADGEIARLKVDPRTRSLGWRTPPVITD
jgi:uncharacterized membrane protein YkoI